MNHHHERPGGGPHSVHHREAPESIFQNDQHHLTDLKKHQYWFNLKDIEEKLYLETYQKTEKRKKESENTIIIYPTYPKRYEIKKST